MQAYSGLSCSMHLDIGLGIAKEDLDGYRQRTLCSGGSRIFERWFPLVVDHRRRGLGAQPPAAEEVLIFKSI